MTIEAPALSDPRLADIPYQLLVHKRVRSLEEAARARHLEPTQIIKTMVVRRAESDFVFVLVPGDRVISWPKLRDHLGVNRLSMPDADEALDVTGYARGTITPFAASNPLPVIADENIPETCSIGAGTPGMSLTLNREDLVIALAADVADVTKPT